MTPTEVKPLKNVPSNIQQHLESKCQLGDYVTKSALSVTHKELQSEITASATAITTAYTAADFVVTSSSATGKRCRCSNSSS